MRAARCREHGPPDKLVVEDVPDPAAGSGEVVVDVHAAAVGYADLLVVEDRYQITVPTPFTPGAEFAGIVREVGEGVTSVSPGDPVAGIAFVGAFAERIVVHESALTPLPDGVDLQAAAGFFVSYQTAYHALRSVARVAPGEHVVVLGAAGGVGLAAVDIATHLGGRVVACASSAAKLEVCRERGAVAAIDYEQEDLKARIREVTGGHADVVLDPVGGPYSEPALRALGYGGRFVTVGFASGDIPRIPLNLVLLKGITIQGFEMRAFSENSPEDLRRDEEELGRLFRDGILRPHIGAVHALSDIAAAARAVSERRALGKVLVDPRS